MCSTPQINTLMEFYESIRHPLVKQRPGSLLLYLKQEGEKKRGQATEVCQSHKGNDYSPFRRLGKHGIRESSKVAQHHRRDRPLPRRFYIYILSRPINMPFPAPCPPRLRPRQRLDRARQCSSFCAAHLPSS
jgi:hypothetical protein